MSTLSLFRVAPSGLTLTSRTSIRGSQAINACSTWCLTSAIVVVLIGSNTRARSPAPKSGRITRSPRSVCRISSTAWRMSSSYIAGVMSPFVLSGDTGNAQPTPRNAFDGSGRGLLIAALADLHLRVPLADGVGRPGFRNHVALSCRRHVVDEHFRAPVHDDATDVRLRAVLHRTGVKIHGCPPRRLPPDRDVR